MASRHSTLLLLRMLLMAAGWTHAHGTVVGCDGFVLAPDVDLSSIEVGPPCDCPAHVSPLVANHASFSPESALHVCYFQFFSLHYRRLPLVRGVLIQQYNLGVGEKGFLRASGVDAEGGGWGNVMLTRLSLY